MKRTLLLFVAVAALSPEAQAAGQVERFGLFEARLKASGTYANPYSEITAEARLTAPGDDATVTVPLFWDGGDSWMFRFSPGRTGAWKWTVESRDAGLNGKSGTFSVVDSERRGSIRPMPGHPHHFQRQDSSPFWFMGDTAWALFTDSEMERHDSAAAAAYVDVRAAQGFNVLHSMLLSEAGWGNQGGLPFHDIAAERINPAYWQEVDRRIAHANSRGIICGLVAAWGDKRRVEPFPWRRFPDREARKRYARYIAARFAAFDVYFVMAGEWHAEIRSRSASAEAVRREFIEIGDSLRAADPQGRMIAIHPMTALGSVREYNVADWMSFGDYQQNYRYLHERILESREFDKPVVNSEYGYLLRDSNGDGVPDKDNSTSLEAMRHATWDIVMAGGYVVTGFGTTYFGGNRDPGPFDLLAGKNKPWERQIGHIKRLFTELEWWMLEPHDELLRCETPRGRDRKELDKTAPPATTYWCLADPGRLYVLYMRGLGRPLELLLGAPGTRLPVRQLNPRTGESAGASATFQGGRLQYHPPDEQDWVLVIGKAAWKSAERKLQGNLALREFPAAATGPLPLHARQPQP